MKVFLGADHRGYKLKELIAGWLLKNDYKFVDLGADYYDAKDDFTLYAEKVASMISSSKGKDLGILLCGSGVGADIVANKIDGVRSSIGKSPPQVKAGREDDNFNVLVIASDFTSQKQALKMVEVFLKTKFDGAKRHKKRLRDISKIEANN